jgi:hypothetical protein
MIRFYYYYTSHGGCIYLSYYNVAEPAIKHPAPLHICAQYCNTVHCARVYVEQSATKQSESRIRVIKSPWNCASRHINSQQRLISALPLCKSNLLTQFVYYLHGRLPRNSEGRRRFICLQQVHRQCS